MVQLYTFPKNEHLCGEKRIGHLFQLGKSFIVYPLRVVYQIDSTNSQNSNLIMVSVPKKRFKRAVERNKLKRLMRESYRLNKEILLQVNNDSCYLKISFNYISNEIVSFELMNTKMKQILSKLQSINNK